MLQVSESYKKNVETTLLLHGDHLGYLEPPCRFSCTESWIFLVERSWMKFQPGGRCISLFCRSALNTGTVGTSPRSPEPVGKRQCCRYPRLWPGSTVGQQGSLCQQQGLPMILITLSLPPLKYVCCHCTNNRLFDLQKK